MNKFTKSLYKLYQSIPVEKLPNELVVPKDIEMIDNPTSPCVQHVTKKMFLDMIQRKDAK